MTYRVELAGFALLAFHHLPPDARDSLIARVALLVDAPWDDATAHPRHADNAYRDAVFGDGNGVLEFHVDEDAQRLSILAIIWADPAG